MENATPSPTPGQPNPVQPPPLDVDEARRYARQLILPEVGVEGQRRLKAARVLCIGAGGLGSPVALYLAAAGVGHLTLVDPDRVDLSNLHRQVLYTTADVGRPKVEVARARLQSINPGVEVCAVREAFCAANALDLVRAHDVVVDGSDNFATRYLSNDACVLAKKPNVYGSVFRFEGQVSLFHPAAGGPCYRCLFPQPPSPGMVPSCAESGVLGILPGVVGSLQAAECLKFLLGVGRTLVGRLLLFDALALEFREISLRRNPACAACGENPTLRTLTDAEPEPRACTDAPASLTPGALKEKLERGDALILVDVREPVEFAMGHLPGALHIPLSQLRARVDELDPAAEVVLYCSVGERSAAAAAFLRRRGFTRVSHLAGGILRWWSECGAAPTQPV
ncbi:MAG: molybdopterin-synthase adenylyltransferase MoeB [Armatimonadota bacterium]|nr:molybdopterin-synthase adenylyltransferase MoeB [Armatimonadota bacterium]